MESDAGLQQAWRAIYAFHFQIALVVAYLVVAFAFPGDVSSLSEASHISAIHALVFFLIVILQAASTRTIFTTEIPRNFPLTPVLAVAPLLFCTVANALLLPVLGVEAWLQDELGSSFSVLVIVQVLAVAEALAAVTTGAVVFFRTRRYAPDPIYIKVGEGDAQTQGVRSYPVPQYLQGYDPVIAKEPYRAPAAPEQPSPSVAIPIRQPVAPAVPNGSSAKSLAGSMSVSKTLPPESLGAALMSRSGPHSYQDTSRAQLLDAANQAQQPQVSASNMQLTPDAQQSSFISKEVMDRLTRLVAREEELTQRVAALSRELVIAATGTATVNLSEMLHRQAEDIDQLTRNLAAAESLALKHAETIVKLQDDISTLQRERKDLKSSLREEKRKADKLKQNLDHEIALNQQARSLILSQELGVMPQAHSYQNGTNYTQTLEAALAGAQPHMLSTSLGRSRLLEGEGDD